MSRSYPSGYIAAVGAGLSAAFVLAGVLAFSYHLGDLAASKRAQGDSYAAQYPADTDKRIADCPTGASVPSLKQCIEEAITASHDAQRSEKDLGAQRQMADWAFWVLIVSCAGTTITAIGTAFLAIQIKLTREAVTDTGKATVAMEKQNDLATEAMQRQLRAYLGCIEIRAREFRPGKTPTFSFKIKNAGQSPAVRVRCVAKVFVRENEIPHAIKIRFGNAVDKSVINILPGQSPGVQWTAPVVEAELYNAVISGRVIFVYAGIVEYWDIFNKRRVTTFKNFLNREMLGETESVALSACTKGNYSS